MIYLCIAHLVVSLFIQRALVVMIGFPYVSVIIKISLNRSFRLFMKSTQMTFTCSKSTMETQDVSIVNFEQILHIVLVFALLTLITGF